MCAGEAIGAPSMSKLIRRAGGGLGEDVFTVKAVRAEVLGTAGMKEIMGVRGTLMMSAQ
jgi:hypothetical protein